MLYSLPVAGKREWAAHLKTYRGIREPSCHVRVLPAAGDGADSYELPAPRELMSAPAVGFDWGADGPGAHYLAVALLADLLGRGDRAGIKAGLPFMRRFLSRLPLEDFEIAETVFRAFLAAAAPAPAPNGGPESAPRAAQSH